MPEPIDHIEALQKRLYSRDPDTIPKRKFGILHPVERSVQSAWGTKETTIPSTVRSGGATRYKRFFVLALLFFCVACGVALFAYYRGAVTISSKNVDLVVLGNSFVAGGEELPIQVEIINKNSTELIDAQLTINYPKGATDETGSDIVRVDRNLGVIGSGKTKSEEIVAVLYGEQGSNRLITATLTYHLQGSSAVFKKETSFSVLINSSPVQLTVDAPSAVIPNQPFSFVVHNSFSGDKTLPNVVTRVEYPNGFIFQSAVPEPTANNNSWALGDMQKGDDKTITITGKLAGELTDEKAFRIYVGTPDQETSSKIAVAYNSTLATVLLQEAFMNGSISVDSTLNGTDEALVALPIGSPISGKVIWTNTSGMQIKNPVITLSIEGDSINEDSITADKSYYDEFEHAIIWNADSTDSIQTIEPGVSGVLPFMFSKKLASNTEDVVLTLSLKGVTGEQEQEHAITMVDKKIIRFASSVQFVSQAAYSTGPIKNTGSYPPKANIETSYTVTWTVLPTTNPLANVTASAVLPAGVVWTGTIVPSGEAVSYNPDTRKITWNIGSLPKATTIPRSKSVSFQVKIKPTKVQVGSVLDVLGETTISGTDVVTKTNITANRPALTTKFDTDPVYTEGKERVIP